MQVRLRKLGVEADGCVAVADLRKMLRNQFKGREWPFEVKRLTDRTMVIVEIDRFGEAPHIYVVQGKRKAVIIDTGCGTADLREFLWTLPELDGLEFQVVNTHVHYDHIMGNHSFCGAGGTSLCSECLCICQGARDRGFSENWTETSLQASVGAKIRNFTVTDWLEEGHKIYLDDDMPSEDEALEVIYTPGHTPDSISMYLPVENRLFTGDLIYPGSLYLFLPGSKLDEFEQSLAKLRSFIERCPRGLVLSCGHITPALPARKLEELYVLLPKIHRNEVQPRMSRVQWHPHPVAVFQTQTFTLICRAEDVDAI